MTELSVPDFIDYPKFFEIDADNPYMFKNMYCYVIEPYPFDGINLYIGFKNEYVVMRMSDFSSNEVSNVDDCFNKKILKISNNLIELMKLSRIAEASYYFSNTNDEPLLVDVMFSANKFASPGFLRDVFGKIVDTQMVLLIDVMSHEKINENKGKILKPSKFKYVMENSVFRPQYGIIK